MLRAAEAGRDELQKLVADLQGELQQLQQRVASAEAARGEAVGEVSKLRQVVSDLQVCVCVCVCV